MSRPAHAAPPAYRVTTATLLARCWSPADAPRLRESLDASDAHMRPWIPWMKDEPRSLAQTTQRLREARARFDRDEDWRYALFAPDGKTLLGETMLLTRPGAGALEIGYWIDVRQAGRGHATAAAAAMTRLAFELHQVERVEIHCLPANEPSARVARKLGYTHEATLKGRYLDSEDRLGDSMIWTLFASAYPGSPASQQSLEAFGASGDRLIHGP